MDDVYASGRVSMPYRTRGAQGGIDHLQRLLPGGVTHDLFHMTGTYKVCSPTHSVREGLCGYSSSTQSHGFKKSLASSLNDSQECTHGGVQDISLEIVPDICNSLEH